MKEISALQQRTAVAPSPTRVNGTNRGERGGWGWGGVGFGSQYQHFSIIKQFRSNSSISLRTPIFFPLLSLPPFKPPHQASRNLFNITKRLKEEIQFPPGNCTHPGEQVVSYLINYRRLVSLPHCCHLLQYRSWKNSKGKRRRECSNKKRGGRGQKSEGTFTFCEAVNFFYFFLDNQNFFRTPFISQSINFYLYVRNHIQRRLVALQPIKFYTAPGHHRFSTDPTLNESESRYLSTA